MQRISRTPITNVPVAQVMNKIAQILCTAVLAAGALSLAAGTASAIGTDNPAQAVESLISGPLIVDPVQTAGGLTPTIISRPSR